MGPPSVLLDHLTVARRAGENFEVAFAAAVETALAVVAGDTEREDWRAALTETAEEWRAGWERRPITTRAELALRAVADPSDREPLPDRECPRCGRAIARRSNARWCSDECRQAAWEERAARGTRPRQAAA